MKITCATCGYENPTRALYCAGCGLVLTSAPRTAPAKGSNTGAWLALAAVAGLSIVSAVFTFSVGSNGRIGSPRSRLVNLEFDLDPSLADAMFDMLAPSDIKVVVGKLSGGVSVRGTPREVEILSRFVSMLTRPDGPSRDHADAFDDGLPTSTLRRIELRLKRSKARALVRVLQCAESPVLLYGRGRTVTIRTTEAEQEIFDGIVDILRGRR